MSQRTAPAWLTEWEYAHRGLHGGGVPENSIAAADAAMALGLGIECDIQRSADGQAIVFHDWELDRLTNGSGPTDALTASELCRLTLLQTAERPTPLHDFLAAISGRVPLLIEIKSKTDFDVEPTCAAVSEALKTYTGDHAVMSFDPRAPAWFARNDRDRLRGLVCTDTLDLGFKHVWRAPGALEMADPDFLAMNIRDLPNTICSLWREAHRPLLSWTIRSAELRQHALANVDALISEGDGLA